MHRRKFLQGLTSTLAMTGTGAGLTASFSASAVPLGSGLYASSRQRKDKTSEAVLFSPQNGDIRAITLPGRAHDIAAHPRRAEVVAVARRPGRFLAVFSADKTQKPLWLTAAKGRHFQGHGVFSGDGRLFFTSENDYDGERGIIGVRDSQKGYRQIGEFPSCGIGVHEIDLHPDSTTLVVANGGILTHPEMGRAKLNLSTMKPSLTYIDSRTGQLLESHSLPKEMHQLSIRHFAVSPQGITIFGCQLQGDKEQRPALVGFHQPGTTPVMAKAPKNIHRQMQNYVGSVSIDHSGTIVATSAPRGNLVAFWDIAQNSFISHIQLADGCGLAPTSQAGHFLISNGQGKVIDYDVQTQRRSPSAYTNPHFHWDNHMLTLLGA